jgi:hypothetical protein
MRKLLLALGVLLVVGAVEYTVGGGRQAVQRELMPMLNPSAGVHGSGKPFAIPPATGPKDAKVRIDVFVNRQNSCHGPVVTQEQTMLKPFARTVRLAFHDRQSAEAQKLLSGYPVACEMVALLNGLQTFRVPWQKEPMVFSGATHGVMMIDLARLVRWAASPEGQKSLKGQRKAFEVERQARLRKGGAGPQSGTGPLGGHGGMGTPTMPPGLPPGIATPGPPAASPPAGAGRR